MHNATILAKRQEIFDIRKNIQSINIFEIEIFFSEYALLAKKQEIISKFLR